MLASPLGSLINRERSIVPSKMRYNIATPRAPTKKQIRYPQIIPALGNSNAMAAAIISILQSFPKAASMLFRPSRWHYSLRQRQATSPEWVEAYRDEIGRASCRER